MNEEVIVMNNIPRAVEVAGTDDVICPICLSVLHHKSVEEGVPDCLYCVYDKTAYQTEFPHQMIGKIK
jgi:hypothetical protein